MQYLLWSVALAHVEDSPEGIAAIVQAALEDSIERVRELFASKTELQVSIQVPCGRAMFCCLLLYMFHLPLAHFCCTRFLQW